MTPAADPGPVRTTLIDIANCIGCRACQVACKQWNEKDGETDRASRPSWASRTRRRSARRRSRSSRSTRWRTRRSREAWNRRSSCSGASTAWSRPASPPVRRRRSTGRPTVRCRTTPTTASAADTACWRVPGTCRPPNGTRARPKISKCTHCADRADQPPPVAFNGQAAVRRRGQTVRQHHGDSGLRQGVPRRRAALRHPRRDAGARAQAHRRPARPVRRPHLRREGAGRDERAVSVDRAVRETRLSDIRREAVSGLHQDGARRRASRRDGRRRLLGAAYAFFRKRAQAVADRCGCVDACREPRPRRIRAAARAGC